MLESPRTKQQNNQEQFLITIRNTIFENWKNTIKKLSRQPSFCSNVHKTSMENAKKSLLFEHEKIQIPEKKSNVSLGNG